MTRFWTEDMIRERLDGTFTQVTPNGDIITQSVGPDFDPMPQNTNGRPKGAKIGKMTYWTPEEEHLLIRQRMLNRTFPEIAWALDRSVDATKKHYRLLMVRGRV